MKNRSRWLGELIVWPVLAACAVQAWAGDINKGYTFSPGEQNVTHTKLNNLVDAAVINPSFFTGKAATTVPGNNDLLLIYSLGPAAFRKTTLTSAFLGNTNLIYSQVETAAPPTNALAIVLDPVNGLRKIQLYNLFTNWPSLAGSPTWLPTLGGGSNNPVFAVWEPATNAWRTISLTNLPSLLTPTNLAAADGLNLTNGELLTVYDQTNKGNRQVSLAVLLTNFSYQVVFPNAGGSVFTQAHYLPTIPANLRKVMVCLTNDRGYTAGTEVDTAAAEGEPSSVWCWASADTNNVYLRTHGQLVSSSNHVWLVSPADGSRDLIDHRRWALKLYWRQ